MERYAMPLTPKQLVAAMPVMLEKTALLTEISPCSDLNWIMRTSFLFLVIVWGKREIPRDMRTFRFSLYMIPV
jgi:hypothetical protein